MINWRECGRKRSWPNSPGVSEETTNTSVRITGLVVKI
jgi:hypothetical protein